MDVSCVSVSSGEREVCRDEIRIAWAMARPTMPPRTRIWVIAPMVTAAEGMLLGL